MSGLILLFVLAVYAALVYWVATRFKRAWIRWVIVLSAIFGPFVQSAIAKYRVAALCRAEYGVHYLRPVTDLKGVFTDSPGTAFPYGEIRSLGIAYQEYPQPNGTGYVKYSVGPGGEKLEQLISQPTARYELRILKPIVLPGNIGKYEVQLLERESGQMVAYSRDFIYAGDWYVRYFRRSGFPAGSDIHCGSYLTSRDLLAPALRQSSSRANGE